MGSLRFYAYQLVRGNIRFCKPACKHWPARNNKLGRAWTALIRSTTFALLLVQVNNCLKVSFSDAVKITPKAFVRPDGLGKLLTLKYHDGRPAFIGLDVSSHH